LHLAKDDGIFFKLAGMGFIFFTGFEIKDGDPVLIKQLPVGPEEVTARQQDVPLGKYFFSREGKILLPFHAPGYRGSLLSRIPFQKHPGGLQIKIPISFSPGHRQ
jgi:hypothetical protein